MSSRPLLSRVTIMTTVIDTVLTQLTVSIKDAFASCWHSTRCEGAIFKAEGKGFATSVFLISWHIHELACNSLHAHDLLTSVWSGLIPSNTVCGGHEQGENRVKFSRAEITISLLWFIASIAVGMVVVGGEGEGEFDAEDDNRRRTREERGLPSSKALRSLARTYLETQRRLWPESIDRELPNPSKDNINKLAGQFKQAFLTGECIAFSSECRNPPWKAIAAGYFRYSCDNSNPRSLDQQLKLALERAKQDGNFIPWTYVFADAAVSGTTAGRTGYTLIKDALCTDDLGITAMYIDEIGRASRDMVQALLLGRLMDKENKRLIGVSDGFDSIAPMWKTILSIFAALQEWFVDQLRAKVKRGMDDAFGRGDNTHAPGVGYKLIPTLDASGKPVVKANGRQKNTVVIDEGTSHYVLLVFRLFTERKRSPDQIGKYFNRRAIDGKTTWDGTRIRSLLSRYKFVGIRVRGRYLQTVDPDTGNV